MKILCAGLLSYWPTYDGASKVLRALAEGLANAGHEVEALVYWSAPGRPHTASRKVVERLLKARGSKLTKEPGGYAFEMDGIVVHSVLKLDDYLDRLEALTQTFEPDAMIVSLEDPSLQMLETCNELLPGRTVALAQIPYALPFGPDAGYRGLATTAALKSAGAIVTVSQFAANYVRRYGKLKASPMYMPVFGKPPYRKLGNFNNKYVTLINPSSIKGISIFMELAKRAPHIQFAAVPTWGATDTDLAALKAQSNVTILRPVDDIEEILAQTKVLLVPSLCREAYPLVVLEAMLRGIPVLASNLGGVPETKLKTDFVFPVRPISKYKKGYDEKRRPIPIVPKQNIQPWTKALELLVSSPDAYQKHSDDSYSQSTRFVQKLSVAPMEAILKRLTRAAQRAR